MAGSLEGVCVFLTKWAYSLDYQGIMHSQVRFSLSFNTREFIEAIIWTKFQCSCLFEDGRKINTGHLCCVLYYILGWFLSLFSQIKTQLFNICMCSKVMYVLSKCILCMISGLSTYLMNFRRPWPFGRRMTLSLEAFDMEPTRLEPRVTPHVSAQLVVLKWSVFNEI